MRRANITLLVAITIFVGISLPVLAEPLQQDLRLEITSPEMGQEVRGLVPIIGSASIPDFEFYKVEFGIGPNPTEWAVIGELHQQPAINQQLEVWNTLALPDGNYSLKVTAVKLDGNWQEFVVRNIIIANHRPTSTPTPTATPTSPPTPTTTSPPPTRAATPTPIIITPQAPLAQATPTPTLNAPVQRNDLPVDPTGWGESFLMGGAAMAAIFVLLGIVFGIRRLL